MLKNYTTEIEEVVRDKRGQPELQNGKRQYKLLTVSDIFSMLVDKAPEGGFGIEDMRKRLPLRSALEKAEAEIDLSAQQLVDLHKIWKEGVGNGWMTLSQDVLDIDEMLEKAVKE